MTEVARLEQGRFLDIRIAVEVMGWRPMYCQEEENGVALSTLWAPLVTEGRPELLYYFWDKGRHIHSGWSPSTLMEDAWPIVEKLSLVVSPTERGTWGAGVFQGVGERGERKVLSATWAEAQTAPLAISHSALRTVRSRAIVQNPI